MPEYRLLYLRGSRLERWETIEACDQVAAVQALFGRGADQTIEVWRDDKKLAIVRPAKHAEPSRPAPAGRHP